MKKNCLSFCFALVTLGAFAWGQKGHDTVAFIAEQHLTAATQAAVDSLLDGRSLVYWANWLDNASHTPEYSYTKTWHYKNIDEDQTFESSPDIPEGNIINALYDQVDLLNDTTLGKEEKALALKMVVHFLGDLHQPMHMGRATDRGGNNHLVRFFGKDSNLHSVWDTELIGASHAWSHSEWQKQIDRLSPTETAEILMEGNPELWGGETYELCKEIYDVTPQGTNIEYDYIAKWTPVIEVQLEKGGLRLADILNSVFDAEYSPMNKFIEK